MRFILTVSALAFVFGALVVWSEEPPTAGTALIDPLAPDAGDFLDADRERLRKTAAEAYRAGDYATAARDYLLYLRSDVTDANNIYNLACCYGLGGNADLAAKYLDRAARAGFDDVGWMKEDPDFAAVRGAPAFDAVVTRLEGEAAAREKTRGGIYVEAASLLPCRVILPEGYDAKRSYPLVVGLHGRGGSAADFATLWDEAGGGWFIYAVPEAPYPLRVGGATGFSWNVVTPDEEDGARGRRLTADYLAAVVKDLKKRYRVSDVYLLGFSQGASYAYYVALTHADLCRGIICFGGWFQKDWFTDEQFRDAQDVRVFISHGRADGTVPFGEGEEARDTLAAYGYDVTFLEFEGGHAVPVEHLRLVRDWMP